MSVIPLKIDNGTRRVGVVSTSLNHLVQISRHKFQIPQKTAITLVYADDGSEIDSEEVYETLSPFTVIGVLQPREEWKQEKYTTKAKFEAALGYLLQSNQLRESAHGVTDLIDSEEDPQRLLILGAFAAIQRDNSGYHTRDQDPEWFKGISPRMTNKDDVMREKARSRVRKYLIQAKEHVKRDRRFLPADVYLRLKDILDQFHRELETRDWFGDYFSRDSQQAELKMCDPRGWFRCEGVYNLDECEYPDHNINPYSNKASYVTFSTWNLDHGVEKGRTVLPELIRAATDLTHGRRINWSYFFDLLFTRRNLRLVHIACHDKTEHLTARCDPRYMYR